MYDYENIKQAIEEKKEEDYQALKAEISGIGAFIEKCLKVVFENSSSKSERDYNITSL